MFLDIFANLLQINWATQGHSETCPEATPALLAVCLGPLSCWKVNLRPSLRSWALSSRFSSRISLYFAPFIFSSSLTILPVPATDKHSHSMMLPPPCFTIGMVPGFLHMWRLVFRPKRSIPSTSWLFLLWHALSTVGPYIDFANNVQSIEFTTDGLQSRCRII